MTAPGISSTPSISSMSFCRSAGLQGAKPTPQLPMTTVVTPWSDEGAISESQTAWASIVGMDVYEARRDEFALSFNLAGGGAFKFRTDSGDHAVLDGYVGVVGLRAGAIHDRAIADNQVKILRH